MMKITPRLSAARRSLAASLLLLCALLSGCGEPPAKQQAAKPEAGNNSEVKAATLKDAITSSGTLAFGEAGPAVDRSVLPTSAPKGAEILTDITPGKRGGQFVMAVPGEPKTFNPLLAQDVSSRNAIDLMLGGLTGYDPYTQKDIPGLAQSWEYKPATQEWVFHIREGLKWSDGQPLTSDDFLFFTQLVFDYKNIPNDEHLFFRMQPKEGSPQYQFSTPDPLTFVAKIPGVDSFSYLNLGLVRPLPRHVLEKPWKEGKFNQTWGQGVNPAELVSCGPYKLKEFRRGQSLIYERNPYYHRYDTKGQQLPYFDQVVVLIVENQQAVQLKFWPAQETDALENIQPNNLADLQDAAKAKQTFSVFPLGPGLNITYFYFNQNRGGTYADETGQRKQWQPSTPGEQPPASLKDFKPFVDPVKLALFSNDEFRIACSEATDRQTIINTILFGEGTPLYGDTSPANKLWYNPQAPQFPYNPASAKVRLEKLGLIDRDGDGIREDAQGHKLVFTMITNRENNIREQAIAQLVQSFKAVGIGVQTQVLNFNDILTRTSESFDFDACLMGLGTGIPPHPAMGGNTWLSSGRMHVWYPEQKSPMTPWEGEIDQLYGSMKQTFKLDEQRQIFFKMQEVLNSHYPVIPLFTGNVYLAAKTKFGNIKPTPLGPSITWNLDELYIK